MTIQKVCTKCNEIKPLGEFYLQKHGKYGRKAVCKKCYYPASKTAREKRQELMNTVPNKLRESEAELILRTFRYECALTGKYDDIGLDHFVPLNWGSIVKKYGIGGTTYANMVPLHRSINSSKGAHNPFYWFERYGKRHNVAVVKWNAIVDYIATKHSMTTIDYINRVNACYIEIVALNWISRVNRRIYQEGSIHYVDIRNALKLCLNMSVVIELFGSKMTKEVFKDSKTISQINEVKEWMFKKGNRF